MIDSSITFYNKGEHRHVTYDEPKKIEILDSGAVRIMCKDGFQTVISAWDSFEVQRWNADEAEN